MVRKQIFAGVLLSVLFLFAVACGGGGGGDDPSGSPTPTPTGSGTIDQTSGDPSFAIYDPSNPTILILGQDFRVRWNAINYPDGVVIRVGLDNDTDPANVIHWFPMSYSNGNNHLDWATAGVDLGKYYFVFKFEYSGNVLYQYSSYIDIQADSPFTIPPTVQLMSPLTSRFVYPDTPIDVRFKVGNAEATATTYVGIDYDQLYTNGVLQWFPTEYVGPGTFSMVWDTSPFSNNEYYIVVKSSNGSLTTYSYSQKITIADFINFGEAPVVEFQLPSSATLVTAGQTVGLRYSVSDVDSIATGMLILDNDDDFNNGWVRVIYTDLPEGIHTYDWSTLGVPPSVYFFAIVGSDNNNQTVEYSPPIIVNPVGQLTEPPVVTITTPDRAAVVPIGAPLSITGLVTDPDSEAMVQIGIDTDNNYENGITGWLGSTFTGTFDVSWITTYYEAGFYYIVVLASDGINQVYKYTDVIELRYLMSSGWTTNSLRAIHTNYVFDGLDSVGAYRALHNQSGSSLGVYESTNKTGHWATSQLLNTAYVDGLIGEFDDRNLLHILFRSGTWSKRTYHSITDPVQSASCTPSGIPNAIPLAIVTMPENKDHCLSATRNGQNVRLYYAKRETTTANRYRILDIGSGESGNNNFWGWMHFEDDGTGHVFARLTNYVDDVTPVTYPIYYITGSGNSWSTPVIVAETEVDSYGIKAFFADGKAQCFVQTAHQIYHVSCDSDGVDTEMLIPEPEEGATPLNIDWAEFNLVKNVPNVIYGVGEEVTNLYWDGTEWVVVNLGNIIATSGRSWLVTPKGAQYFFANTATGYSVYTRTPIGWALEVIASETAITPSSAFSPNGDIVTAYKTASVGEQRLNFGRMVVTTGEWHVDKLNNDLGSTVPVKVFVNKANNVYIRYVSTGKVLTVVTFR